MIRRLLSVKELAAYIGSTTGSIYTLKSKGEIPKNCIVKRGRSLRFDVIAVDKWIEEELKSKTATTTATA